MNDWLNQSPYLVAFVTGLLGGVHCFGMCGGIVGALTLGAQPASGGNRSRRPVLLGYNVGRISGYVVAGAIVGGLSATLADLSGIDQIKRYMALIAALFMVLLGVYLAGIWNGLAKLENLGGVLWKRIQPLGKRFMPVRSLWQAIPLGFLWGWLPCGLVYTALTWSLVSASALQGGLLMLFFGLGTLPNLLAMGVLAERLGHWVKKPAVRMTAGLLVVALGVLTFYQVFVGPV